MSSRASSRTWRRHSGGADRCVVGGAAAGTGTGRATDAVMIARPCVCTVSLARDENEALLIRRTLEHLAHMGLKVVVADGGSPPAFVAGLRALPRVHVLTPPTAGLVAQVQAAFAAARAAQPSSLLYLESDKALFVERHLDDFLQRACLDPDVGAVVAARNDRSFATFPPAQRSAETRINEMTGAMTGQHGDYSYGPFLLNARLAIYVDRVGASAGWGWRHFMFGIAHRLGYRLVHVTGYFECPAEQRAEDEHERRHRERQLEQNIDGLRLSLSEPL
jgi:hypothetical protein